ncbi:hypothetical protein HYR54_17235 [Candidatus Acetothermia bacterium]|nr:hypothetical protein [Candidatus Acetothermia bacterium]MBI3460190.1 hypothetical protein [Candidatus Acetothermia bacterium]MBI3659876.1 hypothetical protein [Candidatus Acetothermia bacterium]
MKTVKTREYSLEDLQEAFGVFVKELDSEYVKTQRLLRRLHRVKLGTEAYDDAWAELYVSLNVLETKANTLREILDEISDLQDTDAEDESN